jgi:hypothetical protein
MNYMKILDRKFPGITASSTDPGSYSQLIFDGTINPPSQILLESKWLEILKEDRNIEIDKRTDELILGGFIYNNILFGLRHADQMNWIGIKLASDSGMITFPFPVTTKDSSVYNLVSTADVAGFFGTGLSVMTSYMTGGRDIKVLINNAVDEIALNTIVDNR